MILRQTEAVYGGLDISVFFLLLKKFLELIKTVSAVLTVRVKQDEDLASLFQLFDILCDILEASVETCSAQVIVFVVDSLKICLLCVGF